MDQLAEIRKAISTLEAQRSLLGDLVVDAALAPLHAKMAQVGSVTGGDSIAGGGGRQRKQVTVLFARISGLAEMADGADAEELNRVLNALWSRLDAVVEASRGIVDKHMGTRLMALFGAPVAHEDDPRQAVRAALRMKQAVELFNAEERTLIRPVLQPGSDGLGFQAGLNTGKVVLGEVGSTGEYTALGDTVNVSSRLEEAAAPGMILVSHATYRQVRGLFDARVTAPVQAKGKSEPVVTYQIVLEKVRAFPVAPRPVAGAETATVGRVHELSKLQAALRAVMARGSAKAVLISGEAGVGKTRLLYEFQNWLELLPEQVWLFQAEAEPQGSEQPFLLLRNLLSYRFEIRESDPAPLARRKLEAGICEFLGESGREQAHFIGYLIGFDFADSPYLRHILDDARQIQGRALHYLSRFIRAMGELRPVVFFLESLQWADQGSLEMIEGLLGDCARTPLFMLALARPAFSGRWPAREWEALSFEQLQLAPLAPVASERLLQEILRQLPAVPARLRDLILRKAGGNPFYIEEMVKMLIDDGVVDARSEPWQVNLERLVDDRIPPTLMGVIQARLDGLTAFERSVLQRAAVVGPVFWDEAVASLAPAQPEQSTLSEAISTLLAREMILRRDESTFADSQEYTFKHAILHSVVYESVLLRQRHVYHAAVAHWLVREGGERVVEYAGLIAEHYEQAQLTELAGQWYARAARRAQGAYLPESAISLYRKALAYLPETDEFRSERLRLYEGTGEMLWRHARRTASMEMYERMQQLAAIAENRTVEIRAWNLLARAHRYLGRAREGLACARRAEALARLDGTAAASLGRALAMQGWCYHALGRPERAISLAEQGWILSQEGEAPREMALNLNLLGVAHATLGRYERGAAYGQTALGLYREMGNRWGMGIVANNLGENARARGDFAAALRFYKEALAIAQETGNRESQIACYNNIGGARLGLGDYAGAEGALKEVLARVSGRGWFALSETHRFLAEAYLGQEQPQAALPEARRALAIASDREQTDAIGSAWRVLGQVAGVLGQSVSVKPSEEPVTAAACFAASERCFATAGMAAERAHTLSAWSDYAREHGSREESERLRTKAQRIFEELGIRQQGVEMG